MLRNYLISTLCEHEPLTVSALGRVIATRYRSYSQAAIYKEIKALKQEGTLVSSGNKVSVHLSWVINTIAKADKLQRQLTTGKFTAGIVPVVGKRVSWHFSNLVSLCTVWNQVVLALFRECEDSKMFEWNPHPWYDLVSAKHEQLLHNAIGHLGRHTYVISGGDTALDHWAVRLYSRNVYTYSFAQSSFEGLSDRHMALIGSYVLTINLSTDVAQRIDSFFNKTSPRGISNFEELFDLLTRSDKHALALENCPRKAHGLRKQFYEYWGHSL